ncbi:MAG: hypothetical protein ACXACY_09860 [Candidatus Hodarchaeales archaeon]|jgi:hypothetical protein
MSLNNLSGMALVDIELLLLILKQICFGSLISGLIIFFLTLFLQGGHLFDHDADLDHDLDHDISIDHDVGDISLDTDIDVEVDVDTGIEVSMDKDVHLGMDKDVDHGLGGDTPTPLMLLLGSFMISFGGSGLILIDSTIHILLLLILVILIPIGTTYIVSKAWSKLAVSDMYKPPLEMIKVDDEVTTLTTVDTEGGLVRILTSSVQGPIKMSAKTKSGAIAKEMIAYVVEVQKNSLIIDEWPSTEKRTKEIPKGTIKWD